MGNKPCGHAITRIKAQLAAMPRLESECVRGWHITQSARQFSCKSEGDRGKNSETNQERSKRTLAATSFSMNSSFSRMPATSMLYAFAYFLSLAIGSCFSCPFPLAVTTHRPLSTSSSRPRNERLARTLQHLNAERTYWHGVVSNRAPGIRILASWHERLVVGT